MSSSVCCFTVKVRVKGKNTNFTFVPSRYDRGMITVCTVGLPVTDGAFWLGCVDRLLGGCSATVIHPVK